MPASRCVLGAHLVLAIGGGDMPVVVSLLNSYSGWAAAAAGFMLRTICSIVTGALVGASGAILSHHHVPRDEPLDLNVVFGGFGTGDAKAPEAPARSRGTVQETTVAEVAERLLPRKQVIMVPGYGMAVAQASTRSRS